MAKVGRPKKVNRDGVLLDTIIAFDQWPAGLHLNLLEFQQYAVSHANPGRTLGDLADLYITWLREKRAKRKLI